MESVKDMWQLVCEHLKKSVGEVIYEIWFKPLNILSFDGMKAEISASSFMKKIIEQQFYQELKINEAKKLLSKNQSITSISEKL